MPTPARTLRQRLVELLMVGPLSARRLAELVGIPERQIEEHLHHIVKSVARDRSLHFILVPSACQQCDFVFRARSRLTRPSRCPRCRSEALTDPQYRIERRLASRA